MQTIRQAPLFLINTSNAPNTLYTRVGYAGSHNMCGYTKAEVLPFKAVHNVPESHPAMHSTLAVHCYTQSPNPSLHTQPTTNKYNH